MEKSRSQKCRATVPLSTVTVYAALPGTLIYADMPGVLMLLSSTGVLMYAVDPGVGAHFSVSLPAFLRLQEKSVSVGMTK
jgi:hypothetical protein